LGDAGIRITHYLGAEKGLTAKELLDTLAEMSDDEIRDMVDKAMRDLTTRDREGNAKFDFGREYMHELYAPRPDSSALYGIGEKPASASAFSPDAPAPTSFAAIRHDPDLLERYYRALDVHHNVLGTGLTDAERQKLADTIARGGLWKELDDLRARQLQAADEHYRSQAEDYGIRHPGFPSNVVYNPTRPQSSSLALTPSPRPATDQSLWAGSVGKSDTLSIPLPAVNLLGPTRPNIRERYPDINFGPYPLRLSADLPILGDIYRAASDAWRGSEGHHPIARVAEVVPQTLGNLYGNFEDWFDPLRGLASEAFRGPADMVNGAFGMTVDAPSTTGARLWGDIASGNYSDLSRTAIEGRQASNSAFDEYRRGLWELSPWGQLESGARAFQELGRVYMDPDAIDMANYYQKKYDALDPLTKALVNIVVDPLNLVSPGAGTAKAAAKEGVDFITNFGSLVGGLENLLGINIREKLEEFFGIKEKTNSVRDLVLRPHGSITRPQRDKANTQSGVAKTPTGATASNQSANLAGLFPPATVHVGSNAAADAVIMQAAHDALARTGIAPSKASQEALYQIYAESGSSLPFEQWLGLLASGPEHLRP
jgi:hypothetical protein